jgi:hypothetical protein
MIGEVISIYGSTVFFLFFGSSNLFFILLKASRRRGSKTLKRYFKVYSVIVLGVLVLFGAELIFGGVTQVLSGEPGGSPWIPWIMIGGGSAILTVAGLVLYLIFIAGAEGTEEADEAKKGASQRPMDVGRQVFGEKDCLFPHGQPVFAWFVIPVVISGTVVAYYTNRAIILAKLESSSRFEVIAFSLLMLFILVPALLMAVSWTRSQLKYGKSVFEMSTYPGIVGGELAGTIYTRMKEIPKDGFKVQLVCELTEHSSSRSRMHSTGPYAGIEDGARGGFNSGVVFHSA